MRKVTEIFVWVSENSLPREEEGIMAGLVPGMGWASFTTVREKNARSFRPTVEKTVRQSGRRARLLRLEVVEEVDVVEP